MKFVRSKRLECFCKNSYALFVTNSDSNEYNESNRRGNCFGGVRTVLDHFSNLTNNDWRVDEFLRNEEESSNVCFRDEVVRGGLHGSGKEINE